MDTTSVAYVLCRIEDDLSLTPISEHEDIVAAVVAGKHQVEVEDFDFSYGLYVDGGRVACFAEGRAGCREWARSFALGEKFEWWDTLTGRAAAKKGTERFYSVQGYPKPGYIAIG